MRWWRLRMTGGVTQTALHRLSLLGTLLVVPLGFGLYSIAGATATALAVLVVSALVAGALVEQQRRSRRGNRHVPATTKRGELLSWLDAKFSQPSERGRLAVIAASLDLPDEEIGGRGGSIPIEPVLAEIENRFRGTLREDDLIARGDVSDFLICLSRVRAPQNETLLRLAQRLQSCAQVPLETDGKVVIPRVTIGMASSRHTPYPNASVLIGAAEDALEGAIAQRVGSLAMSDLGRTAPREDAALLAEIEEALDDGQITAWYQPQLSTETGDISGFEALARWEHPTRGVISPASFLPLIERAGLSRRLAKVILTHSLSALRTWDRAGLGIPGVGVNFSADELREENLADFLRWELDRFDLQPSRLVVEVLESVVAESHEDAIARNLRKISAMGCRIDLDDFGTGFTSIINIRRFDVSRIKIDRKLVTGAGTDQRQRDLIAALLSMSEHLRVDTLGEGVETKEEHLALAQLGCGHVQGFAIARPMPLGDTLAWVLDHRARMAEARKISFGAAGSD